MNRRKVAIGLVVVLTAGLVLLWGSDYNWHEKASTTDDWYTPSIDWEGWVGMSDERYKSVPAESRAEAVQRLDDVSFVELSDKDLKTFAPNLLSPPEGCKPYLIRGLFLHNGDGVPMRTGGFSCSRRGSDVLVAFGCLGYHMGSVCRGPLVVWLSFQPQRVFVTYSMAR